MVSITKVSCPDNQVAIKCPYWMSPTRIVIHNTANDASAMSEVSYMLGNANYTSFHYAVDNTRAVQGIEENRNSWNAGDGGDGIGNRQGISIEICYSKSGGDVFTQSERNGAELTADILRRYGWGIGQVTKHQDYSGKYCPHRTLDLGWQRFLDMVQAILTPPVPEPVKPVWVAMDNPRSMLVNTPLVNVITGAVVKTYASNAEIGFIQRTDYNGQTYLRTAYSTNNNIDNGFLLSGLSEIVITPPVVEPPVIEPPVVEPPIVETPATDTPVAEDPIETPTTPETPDQPSETPIDQTYIWLKFFKLIWAKFIEIIKGFKKE